MAKREKIDISDIFLDGAMSAQERAKAMSSPVWAIAVAAYSTCERKLRIAAYVPEVIYMTNEQGFNVFAVMRSTSIYKVYNPHDPIMLNKIDGYMDGYLCILETENPRYVVSVLRKASTHRVKDTLMNSLHNADNFAVKAVRNTLDFSSQNINNGERFAFEHMEMDSELRSYVAEIVASGASWEYVKPEIRAKFDREYQKYNKNKQNFNHVLDRLKDMFSTDKWLYVPLNGGVVLGVVNHHVTETVIEKVRQERTSSAAFYSDVNFMPDYPPKWYRTYEDVPENIRRDFEMACLMFKTHAGYEGGILPPKEIAAVNGSAVWEAVGATYRKYYNEEPVYLITKV